MGETQIVVDVEASALSESMQCKLDRRKTNEAKNFTIFRTPHNISESKKNLFEPSVISIGPFHRGKKSLQVLEEHKWKFLQYFLSRGDHISLDLCISEMKLLEERTRKCYSETVDLESNAFVEMMLLDGCFMIEYFLILCDDQNSNSIIEVGWNSRFIERDLLLLENQIPYFIVDKLFEIGLNPESRMEFVKHIAAFFLALNPIKVSIDSWDKIPDPPAEIHHLVHLYYHYLVPNQKKPVELSRSKLFDDLTRMSSLSVPLPNSTRMFSLSMIPSATELKQKGLKFTPKSNPEHMLDISFEYGVLKIPRLKITDSTKPLFANLVAFEQSNYGKENSPFSSFVYFVDNLVNTQNDVTILQECEIIENLLGSEEELTHFIHQVTEGTFINGRRHYLAELYKEVNTYIGSSWNRHRAKLVRNYFSSPWAAISLVAAFMLIVLTLVQSFYAVYAYYIPPSS